MKQGLSSGEVGFLSFLSEPRQRLQVLLWLVALHSLAVVQDVTAKKRLERSGFAFIAASS